ncbi:uncharacterized protein SPAPADRAFT_63080 [Spathaspora passalidarum NRRL Y-27907]|uniref:UBC core domain-containing protein n=1 Tax=Spathaspora passalidarum (strain NRRL Y-27907 / 11-Y1) TaxID=619300 RepID=G3AT06_SPAPN|nr:uncharacterized protein SPAPADRAFT_63080 [Spathaspora passalidarum NRRL Y-27907]EGW31166.1 hypothetical protein SPAPADRAFT_63080 [Spathaspora passalidarum NRRL Y-27907]
MAERRLFQEYNRYKKSPPSKSNPQIISLNPISEDNIFNWQAIISKPTKKDNPFYYGGQWKLSIAVSRQYPLEPPVIKFITPIVHPNINLKTGEICLDILKKDAWSPAWNLEHLLVAILMLLDSPEPDSPLNIDAANLYRHDPVGFQSMVQFNMWKVGSFVDVKKSTPTTITKSNQVIRDVSGSKIRAIIA